MMANVYDDQFKRRVAMHLMVDGNPVTEQIIGELRQFVEQFKERAEKAEATIRASLTSATAPVDRCPSCGSREKIARMCMVENCGEPHFEQTSFSSTHAKVVCSDSWH